MSGDLLGISKSSAHRSIHKAINKVFAISSNIIKYPENGSRIKFGFRQKCEKINDVIGAIYGTHIKIQSPGGLIPEVFRNKKDFSALMCKLFVTNDAYSWML